MNLAISPRRRRLAPLLAALAMFGPFSIDTIFPAFPSIARDLDASPIAMQQTISVYMIAYALMSLFHGPLSDALGRRRVILAGVAVFVLASVGCALAGTIGSLLAFRALQGISAGAGLIVGRAIIRDCFEGVEAQRLMAAVSMIFGIAPAIAPIVGGWVVAIAHWPMIFWLLAAFAAALWLVCLVWLPETHPLENRVPLSLDELATTYRRIGADRAFLPLALAGTLNFNALFVVHRLGTGVRAEYPEARLAAFRLALHSGDQRHDDRRVSFRPSRRKTERHGDGAPRLCDHARRIGDQSRDRGRSCPSRAYRGRCCRSACMRSASA